MPSCILADFDAKHRQCMLKLAKENKNQWCVIGTHPWKIDEENVEDWKRKLTKPFIETHSIVGIGEVGLDYVVATDVGAKRRQQEALDKQLLVASSFSLPLVLHSVRAHQDLLAMVKTFPFGGIIHGFGSSYEIALEYVKRGFLISIGEAIQNPKKGRLAKAIAKLGLDHIVVESDAHAYALSRIDKTYERLAQIFKLDIEAVKRITEKNLEKTFRLRCSDD